ncbi:MAG TPA: hypothetical protein VK308_04190 [Pyrinomonadaceae bacterium]|jgi:hypothetical protein|nr:hypothetical protein [Pyrinomonadaceae bacterium]
MPGFFDFIFYDQTADWNECFRVPLSINLYTESVNNVAIGDSYEKLRNFGRPNNRKPFKKNHFIYYPLGMEISGTDGKIHSFDFIFRSSEEMLELNEDESKYVSCELSIINKNGGHLSVNKNTSRADVERFFGTPTEKDDEDEDYLSLIYQYGKLCLDFEFGEGKLFERLHFGLW